MAKPFSKTIWIQTALGLVAVATLLAGANIPPAASLS